ncbi:thiamine pyrophosphate-dependent enzyme [Megasphaera hominis]|jgi:2-oxoglutarate ferredoxin oxidoreductase subunit beta|uniref:Keto:oxoacid ferredoxin oxidoreductase n=1 Tax=Megasphaera hominis TaxID=159836 RepID=A0ABR6VIP3_9FIRM|nr:thiamine pyrophosphate-dependent enzyme [Megasphaera hominis]MBC3537162.1 keto:oxoacid ferredoxin oxidoreductase [Megasphaera hominis]
MAKFAKPESIVNTTEYCGGCGHGIIQRLIAESIEELNLQDKTIGVVDIACSYWSLDALDYDMIAGPHGRLAAVATGIKRVRPEANVYVHSGDGCAYVIGLSETSYAAIRDVPITMIVANNGIFGMTGGQLNLATTLVGDKTVSSKAGRNPDTMGHPVDMLKSFQNYDVEFLARGALYDVKHIEQTKKFIKKGLENQRDGKGFSLIEVLSPCPTNWKLDPVKAMEKIKNENEKIFPVGVYTDRGGVQ